MTQSGALQENQMAEIIQSEAAQVTKEDIEVCLRGLGLGSGCDVGVHSSLSAFGHVAGGADAVIDALLETVAPGGTVVMPTYSTNRETVELTEEDVSLGVTYKFRILPYNAEKTPCWTGKIPNTFWRREKAIRNLHRTHSLAAIGPKADVLSQAWDNLLDADGHVLLVGVTLACCSAMHLAEKEVRLPDHILEKTTPPAELAQRYRNDNIGFGYGPYPDFAKMEGPCIDHGIMKTTQVGDARIRLLRLRELIDLYAAYLRKDADAFYVS